MKVMINKKDKKYMALAQKKSRFKKKLEKEKIIQRIIYLENALPFLKSEVQNLKEEYNQLSQQILNQDSHVSTALDFKENLILKQEISFYRSYRKSIASTLQILNKKSCLQNVEFVVRRNFFHLLRKTAQINSQKLHGQRFSANFGTRLENVKFEVSQKEMIKNDRVSRLIRIRAEDIPLNKNEFYKAFQFLVEDRKFLKYLYNLCQPEHKDVLMEWENDSQRILKTVDDDVEIISGGGFYIISGTFNESNQNQGPIQILSSIVSDFTKSVEKLYLTDPNTLQVQQIEDGKDDHHCNVEMCFQYQDAPSYKTEKAEECGSCFRNFAYSSLLPMPFQNFQLFLNQCLKISE